VAVWTYADAREVKFETPAERLMVGVQGFAAEDYRYQIKAKTREALIRKAKLGHVTGTRTYGYDTVRVGEHSERRVNASEAAIVKRIFEMVADGYGDLRVVSALNSDHVPGPGKGSWSKEHVRNLTANDIYRGVLIFGKSRSVETGGRVGKRETVPADDWMRVPVPALRIVSDELWSKVQRLRAAIRARYMRTAKGRLAGKPEGTQSGRYLLNSMVRCPECGGPMAYNGKGKRYYCTSRARKGACANGTGIPMSALDTSVLDALHAMPANDAIIDEFCERLARAKQERAAAPDVRANLEAEAARLETAIARPLDQVEAGQSVGPRLKEREAELEAVRGKLAEPVALDLDREGFAARLRDIPILNGDPVQARQVLRKIGVERITLEPDGDGGYIWKANADFRGVLQNGAGGSGVAPPDVGQTRGRRAGVAPPAERMMRMPSSTLSPVAIRSSRPTITTSPR
jgi:hypothetical protein